MAAEAAASFCQIDVHTYPPSFLVPVVAVRIVPQLLLLVYYNVVVQRIWLERRWGFGLKWGIGDIRIWKFFGISNSAVRFLLLKRKSTEGVQNP